MILAVEFYDQVLRELITAVGAALFVANAYALYRRRRPSTREPSNGTGAKPVSQGQLTKAPIARTVTFMLIGFVVMIWGIASLVG